MGLLTGFRAKLKRKDKPKAAVGVVCVKYSQFSEFEPSAQPSTSHQSRSSPEQYRQKRPVSNPQIKDLLEQRRIKVPAAVPTTNGQIANGSQTTTKAAETPIRKRELAKSDKRKSAAKKKAPKSPPIDRHPALDDHSTTEQENLYAEYKDDHDDGGNVPFKFVTGTSGTQSSKLETSPRQSNQLSSETNAHDNSSKLKSLDQINSEDIAHGDDDDDDDGNFTFKFVSKTTSVHDLSKLDATPSRDSFGKGGDNGANYKIHFADHQDLSGEESSSDDDITAELSPIDYSSQAASIFFGGTEEEPAVVRPRNIQMNGGEGDDLSQGSSASA